MSIFDIPELTALIGSYLPTHTLLDCVRVNKAWNALFTPMLWKSFPPTPPKDPPPLTRTYTTTTSTIMTVALSKVLQRVRELVYEDYLHTTHQQLQLQQLQLQQQQRNEQRQHADLSLAPGRLSKNGRWIQHLDLYQVYLSKNPPQAPYFRPLPRIHPRTWPRICGLTTRIATAPSPPLVAPLSATGIRTFAGSPLTIPGGVQAPPKRLVQPPSATVATATATEQDLILHLLRHCTHLQSLHITGTEHTEDDVDCWDQIMMTRTSTSTSSISGGGGIELSSTLRDLWIDLSSDAGFSESRIAELVFGRCFPRLRRLRFHITSDIQLTHLWLGKGSWRVKEQEQKQEQDQDPLLELRELSVTCNLGDNYPAFWPRFLSRCVNLTSLNVTRIDRPWIHQSHAFVHLESLQILEVYASDLHLLTDAFKSGILPRLNSIHIDKYGTGLLAGADVDIAEMLKAGSTRWRSVNLPGVEELAIEVLMEHSLTLEHLILRRCRRLTSAHIQQFLASCPRLVTFSALEEDTYEFNEKSNITAQDFIDLNTSSDSLDIGDPAAVSSWLRPWKCESTLKVFRAKVTGIPRPDVSKLYFLGPNPDRNILLESYLGQGFDLQRRVYERFARFTNLERLELGNYGFGYNLPSIPNAALAEIMGHHTSSDGTYGVNNSFHDYQNHCLSMNLESGLGLLGGLKRIKEVRLIRMLTDIREADVAWMMEHWPKLEFLGGLNAEIYGLSVQMWIEKEYPDLKTQVVFLE